MRESRAKQGFAAAAAAQLGKWVATIGDELRKPPDSFPIPDEYDLVVRTTWQGSTATVAVSINGIEVRERFRFSMPIDVDARFISIVRRLWTRYLEKATL